VQHSGALQTSRPLWVTISLAMGIASPVLFVVIVVVGGLIRPGYSHISQAISELTEAGAINKPLLDMGLYITEFMTIAFGLGVLWAVQAAGTNFKASAMLLVMIAVIGLLFGSFPMDPVAKNALVKEEAINAGHTGHHFRSELRGFYQLNKEAYHVC